ncbi:putative late blight resistance protein homolog R1B-17 [Cornus florida]|uniref:putative late blight resistance protein homolog R1B-17 n=1 Tax=Cornus florida TaxID=4283 RepID=UPI00289AF85E|nr:putative late blight resistance protein homolog R1B-17 [Cornus florida]
MKRLCEADSNATETMDEALLIGKLRENLLQKEDYSITRGRLVCLWIAEGFVKEDRGKTVEEVAEEYLKELVRKSLVQMLPAFKQDLQELKLVDLANDDGGSLVDELIMVRQLRKLSMDNVKKRGRKESLHSSVTRNDIIDLQHISSPPDSLQRLVLTGHLEKYPCWISKLRHLITISLNDSRLTEDPLKFLQTLPSLVELVLVNAYDGKALHFEAGVFLKLERLDLVWMTKLISVKADAGALPLLKYSERLRCPRLTEVASCTVVIFSKKFSLHAVLQVKCSVTLAALVYHIWEERNAGIFRGARLRQNSIRSRLFNSITSILKLGIFIHSITAHHILKDWDLPPSCCRPPSRPPD